MKLVSVFLSLFFFANVSLATSLELGPQCISKTQVEFLLHTALVNDGILNVKAMDDYDIYDYNAGVDLMRALLAETKVVQDSTGNILGYEAETDSVAGGGYYTCTGMSYKINCDGSGLSYNWFKCYGED